VGRHNIAAVGRVPFDCEWTNSRKKFTFKSPKNVPVCMQPLAPVVAVAAFDTSSAAAVADVAAVAIRPVKIDFQQS
jgi:hypothetical protein